MEHWGQSPFIHSFTHSLPGECWWAVEHPATSPSGCQNRRLSPKPSLQTVAYTPAWPPASQATPAMEGPLPGAPVPCLLLASSDTSGRCLVSHSWCSARELSLWQQRWLCVYQAVPMTVHSLHPWSFAISSQPSTWDPLDLLSSPWGPPSDHTAQPRDWESHLMPPWLLQ